MLSLVPPVTRSLLRPHLEDVDNKIQPGAMILTWASMNIDGYLHHIHQVPSQFAALNVLLKRHTGMLTYCCITTIGYIRALSSNKCQT